MTITSIPDDSHQPVPDDDEQSFDNFAATMPETAQGFLDADMPPSSASESGEDFLSGATDTMAGVTDSLPPERKRVNVTKKVRRAMNRFKTKVADVPIMWFHQQAKNNPEWELDKDEQDLLKDAIETVFDVLDIEVEIQPLSWTLSSVWWVLSYPILAFGFLYLTKKSQTMERENPFEEQDGQQ